MGDNMFVIKLRRDWSARWTRHNPVLTDGEPGYEMDTGKFKIGDGSTRWIDLPYFTTGGGGVAPEPEVDPTHLVGDPGEPPFTAPWGPWPGGVAPGFWKIGNIVYLQGIATNAAGAWAPEIFILPEGYRPAALMKFATVSDGLFTEINVTATGQVRQLSGPTTSPALDGIQFRL